MFNVAVMIYLINFLIMGSLPKWFFKKNGRFNIKWWMTSAPFLINSIFLILLFTGVISPVFSFRADWERALDLLAVPFSVASIALIFFTAGSHSTPLALWHQEDEAPEHLVQHGPYRWVRHPFYGSFLLLLVGTFILIPDLLTLLTLLYGAVALNLTARREEQRFLASSLRVEYKAYIHHTGRFLPHLMKRIAI